MEQQPLLAIAIPTYNREPFLENLLKTLMPQVAALHGEVLVTIFNNSSKDATDELVARFQKMYPGLIAHYQQPKNMGANVNFATALEKSEGRYVWLLGDDDSVVSGGVKKVVDFIINEGDENAGLLVLGHQSYFIEETTQKKVVYFQTVEASQPKSSGIPRDSVLRLSFPNNGFISILAFRKKFLEKVFSDEKELLQEALRARDYIYTFIYRLMFLKYPMLRAQKCNELIVTEDLHYYKFTIEDRFQLHYVAQKKLRQLLLAVRYMNDHDKGQILGSQRGSLKNFIVEMGLMKAFGTFNYSSLSGCMRNFFKKTTPGEAMLFSFFFIMFYVCPAFLLKSTYKLFTKARMKKRHQEFWLQTEVAYSRMAQGSRRQLS